MSDTEGGPAAAGAAPIDNRESDIYLSYQPVVAAHANTICEVPGGQVHCSWSFSPGDGSTRSEAGGRRKRRNSCDPNLCHTRGEVGPEFGPCQTASETVASSGQRPSLGL